jgi:hypothetical protein
VGREDRHERLVHQVERCRGDASRIGRHALGIVQSVLVYGRCLVGTPARAVSKILPRRQPAPNLNHGKALFTRPAYRRKSPAAMTQAQSRSTPHRLPAHPGFSDVDLLSPCRNPRGRHAERIVRGSRELRAQALRPRPD